jgi:outer membrane protein
VKNISLALNAVLLVAVAVLYYLHFSDKKTESVVQKATMETVVEAKDDALAADTIAAPPIDLPKGLSSNGTIAYIDLEEFFDKYIFYKQGVVSIERSIENKRKQLMGKQKQLEEDYQSYQAMAASLTENHRKVKEQQLMEQEQDLYKLRDQLEEAQANEMKRFNEKLLKKVDDYLKTLSKEKNYSYVFTYVKGGPATLVYAKDSLDITDQVLKSLNAVYQKKK